MLSCFGSDSSLPVLVESMDLFMAALFAYNLASATDTDQELI